MLVQRNELFAFLLLVLHTCFGVVVANRVQTVKSNSVTRLELRLNDDDLRAAGEGRWRRDAMSRKERDNITALHNELRSMEGASDMEYMKWNSNLADLAQQWANGCNFEHGQPPHDKSLFPYSGIGQNLYATTGTLSFYGAIKSAWYDEKQWYNYDRGCQSGKVCGHYTQVVWASSNEIGCAYALCPNLRKTTLGRANYFVCNYGPPGNYVGEKPFKRGTACSNCQNKSSCCTRKLCNRDCSRVTSGCVADDFAACDSSSQLHLQQGFQFVSLLITLLSFFIR